MWRKPFFHSCDDAGKCFSQPSSAGLPNDAPPSLYRRCGYCLSCRLHKSYEWAIRGYHEHSVSKFGTGEFVTLTFDDDYLPDTLDYKFMQNFIKRVRKAGYSVRYMACGEYGEKTQRPHFHAILFGVRFPDRIHFKTTPDGFKLYNSAALSKLWKFGHAVTGDISKDSIAYVARYTLKKKYGKNAIDHYFVVDPDTGEVLRDDEPEMMYSSKCPAIGIPWLQKYYSDIYPHGYLIFDNKKMAPPRSYNLWIEKNLPLLWQETTLFREEFSFKKGLDLPPDFDRLSSREFIVNSLTKADRS